jgi:CheY-like chemotaxis protein
MTVPTAQAEEVPDTILVVEDDHMIRVSIRGLLEDEGYTVLTVTNGRAALEVLHRTAHRPSLILLDLMLPVMDGRAFVAELQRMPHLANIPVVVMTGYDLERPIEGVSSVLKKPVRGQQLLDVLVRLREPIA